MCLFYLYATAKSEIQICSNKHETCLVYVNIKAIHNFEKDKILVIKDLDIYGSVFDMTSLGISAGRGVKSLSQIN